MFLCEGKPPLTENLSTLPKTIFRSVHIWTIIHLSMNNGSTFNSNTECAIHKYKCSNVGIGKQIIHMKIFSPQNECVTHESIRFWQCFTFAEYLRVRACLCICAGRLHSLSRTLNYTNASQ